MRLIVSAISARGTVMTASCTSCSSRRRAPSAEPAWIVPMPPGMSGAPCFEQIEGLSATDLTDRNAIRPEPKRGADKIRERGNTVLGPQRDQILCLALQLARVLDQYNPVSGPGNFGKQSIDQSGLARRCAAGHEDIAPVGNGSPQHVGLRAAHHLSLDIIFQREDRDSRVTDCKRRGGHHGWDQPFEALTSLRQFG